MLTKRELLFSGGAVLATAVVAEIGGDVWGFVRDSATKIFDEEEYDIATIKSVFGSIDTRASFVPGQSHPNPRYAGDFHPDDEYVADIFDELVRDIAEDRLTYDSDKIPQSLEGTVLVSGSPVSNATARYLLDFHYVDQDDRMGGLIRAENPVFETEFEFLLSKNALGELGISNRVGRTGVTGNWSIANRRTGDLYVAESINGRLISDFLLVTRLPNIFDQGSFTRNEGVFLMAGSHGVGTKAVDLVLKDKHLLESLRVRVGATPYWQALFQVDSVDHYHRTEKFGERWHPVSLSREFEWAPVSFDTSRLGELARWEA